MLLELEEELLVLEVVADQLLAQTYDLRQDVLLLRVGTVGSVGAVLRGRPFLGQLLSERPGRGCIGLFLCFCLLHMSLTINQLQQSSFVEVSCMMIIWMVDSLVVQRLLQTVDLYVKLPV